MYLFKKYIRNKNGIFNFLLIFLLIHLKYGVTYIKGIIGHFNLGLSLINNQWSNLRNYYWSDSPLLHILQKLFKINDFENYILFIYLFTIFILFLISHKLTELDSYSIFFIFSGWLISVSWNFGLVDSLIVLIILHLSIDVIKKRNIGLKQFLLNTFLIFNHFALGLFFNIILYFIWNDKNKVKIKFLFISFLIGFFTNYSYKLIIGFEGETRLHYLLRPNVIPGLFENNPEVFQYIFFSSFYGFLPLLIFFLYKNFVINFKLIFTPLFIALFGSSLAADSSRILSYLVIPLLVLVIFNVKEYNKFEKQNLLLSFSLIITIFFNEYWVIDNKYVFSGFEYGGDSRIIYEVLVDKIRSVFN